MSTISNSNCNLGNYETAVNLDMSTGDAITAVSSSTGYPYIINDTFVPYNTITPNYAKSLSTNELFKDFLDEIESKYNEIENKMDELVKMMKENRENTHIYNATFQYYVGMKTQLTEIIQKVKKYIDEN